MTHERWREFVALGHAARRNGRLEEALAHYASALALAPDSAEANGVYGLMLLQLNRTDEAAAPLKRAVDLDPAHPDARMNLAELHARQGDVPGALRILEAVAADAPHAWWIREKLGELKAGTHRYAEAAAHFREAAERSPGEASLLYKWARATFDSGSPAAAKAILDRAALLAPGHEAILRLYAEIHEGNADWDSLARTAQSWLRTQPQNPLPWMFAARSQWETGYLTQAMQSYRAFLERGGGNALTLATYGRLCMTALAWDEAARALDEAERLDAGCAHMLSARATLSMFRGEFGDALAYARRAVTADPQDTAAYKVLVQVTGGHLAPDEVAELRRLSEYGELPLQHRIAASFALADCLDARGDVATAFAAYQRANELCAERARNELLDYESAERERQVDRLISLFPGARPPGRTKTGPTPIFIVGMPRSGTTLVESVIGAHSRVYACGERQEMRSIVQEFMVLPAGRGMSGVPETTKQRWREAYWRELPDSSERAAVTDKNPWNFDALGLILELFPDARVIHVRRDPVETGLSIFRSEFPKFASFAHRLEDIGHYYGQYARLMAHWEKVLPGRFLTVQYEDLVADDARALPELLQFCGLEWEDACRDFSTSKRVISTMSAVQARRPLTGFRQGRSGRYAPHLAPLIAALASARVDLRSGAYAPDR